MSGNQLAFNLSLPFPYSPETFVPHAGVRLIIERFVTGTNTHLECVVGGERTGKTHLAVHLVDKLSSTKISNGDLRACFVHASDLAKFFIEPSDAEIYLIDDVDRYLEKYDQTGSAPLVGFIEFCRARNKKIILFSAVPLTSFAVDKHLGSRFASAVSLPLEPPKRDEIGSMLPAFAAQRALKFDAGVFDFLQLRLPASIPAIDAYFARLTTLSYLRSGKKVNREMLQDALAN